MPRLFTGLEIPQNVARELALMRGGLFGARWIDPELYHLTLRFAGDIDRKRAMEFYHELERIRRPGFAVTIESIVAFGGDRPHSLVAQARATPDLMRLQAEHERAARRVGLPPEARKFTPHVTLARLRGLSAGVVADYLNARGTPGTLSFEVDRFILFSSRDGVGGGPYIEEASFPLDVDEYESFAAEYA